MNEMAEADWLAAGNAPLHDGHPAVASWSNREFVLHDGTVVLRDGWAPAVGIPVAGRRPRGRRLLYWLGAVAGGGAGGAVYCAVRSLF